ncbi:MAG: bifunctional methylenetetrahydrofolate dehydrogenase/methenyltetrahydrofolate cyclohydrolase FolD [Alphaproteobacteria bacterium]
MTAEIIDGKAIAGNLRTKLAVETATLKTDHGITPGLSVVLVGEDPASQIYVRNKERQTREAGMNSAVHRLEQSTSQPELVALIEKLNQDRAVHGILVQLPLPDQIDEDLVLGLIDPAKDVDGFHVINAGKLATGQAGLAPCTPTGCVILAKSVQDDLTGLEAVIIGRSNIVGKPLAQLLLAQNCTVTIAHSRTRDLPKVAARADLLIAAVGRPELVKGDWVKPGAIIIDVGINRVPGDAGKTRLVGDVDFAAAAQRARAITPVPGGVGPMTIACLLKNTLAAARALHAV